MPFVASWRTFEKTLNPAVRFILSCTNCNQQNMKVISSKKTGKTTIGLQCQTEDCGQTIKFERPLAMDESMPERFHDYPETALKGEHVSKKGRLDKELAKTVLELFEETAK